MGHRPLDRRLALTLSLAAGHLLLFLLLFLLLLGQPRVLLAPDHAPGHPLQAAPSAAEAPLRWLVDHAAHVARPLDRDAFPVAAVLP